MKAGCTKNAARMRGRHFLIVLLCCIMLVTACVMPGVSVPESGTLQMIVIDVGQGDSILLIGPSGQTMLVDCGTGQSYGRVVGEMKNRGVAIPDIIIGTHPHTDHVGSLPGILKHIGAGRVYMNGADDGSRLYAAVMREASNRGLAVEQLRSGDVLHWDPQVRVDILGPEDPESLEANNSSVIVRLHYGKHIFLLTGDAEAEAEAALLRRDPEAVRAHVVKVPHHGSSTSSTPAFVKAVGAKLALVSHGENAFGHPHPEVVSRWRDAGAEIYSTADNGSLTVESDGDRLWLEGENRLQMLVA